MSDRDEPLASVYDQINGMKLKAIVRFALKAEQKAFRDRAKMHGAFEKEFAALSADTRALHGLESLSDIELAFAMGWADFTFGPSDAELHDGIIQAALEAALEAPPGA